MTGSFERRTLTRRGLLGAGLAATALSLAGCSTPVVAGSWWVTAVCLAQHPNDPPTAAVNEQQLTVTWADARVTTCTLPHQQ